MHALLTFHGTLVCVRLADGALTHRPRDQVPAGEQIAWFRRTGDKLRLARPEIGISHIRVPVSENGWLALDAGGGLVRTVLAKDPVLGTGGKRVRGYERFVPIGEAELALVDMLAREPWVVRSTGELLRTGEVALAPGPALRIGSRLLDLSLSFPQIVEGRASAPDRLTLFFEGWRADELLSYRPLVYYVAFGRDWVFDRLAVALRSLARLGNYSGDILIIGDRSAEQIAALAPDIAPERIRTMPLEAASFVDYCAARYRVGDWRRARAHAPLLYMDIDVVVDLPLDPFMARLRASDHVSAQREAIAPLATSGAVGATLFAQDGIPVGDACGFNSGIIGIPSLQPHGRTLVQIAEAIRLYARRFGKAALSHFDQAIANYVTAKLMPIDDRLVTGATRWTRAGVLQGGSEPMGFVHFWGSGGRTTRVMRRYVDETGRAQRQARIAAKGGKAPSLFPPPAPFASGPAPHDQTDAFKPR